MSDAKINLIAALIVLFATLIPIVGTATRFVSDKRIGRLVISLCFQLAVVGMYLSAVFGNHFGYWSNVTSQILLFICIPLSAASFLLAANPPTRLEIVMFVLMVAALTGLIGDFELRHQRAQSTTPPKADTSSPR